MQKTISHAIRFDGIALHSGRPARLVIRPAPAGSGIVFRRTDLGPAAPIIPASWDRVVQSPLCTRLVGSDGISVSTVEHVMAALVGCGIHNATLDIDGSELPIVDGSAAPFVTKILAVGLVSQAAPVQAFRIVRPVEVSRGATRARLSPNDTLRMEFTIDFADAAIGVQTKTLDMSDGSFVRELSNARTFCRKADVDLMHAKGLALGGSLENAVVVDGDKVLSPGGLRHADEAVRHKMLDALGDLGLAGLPVIGLYQGVRAGHALTNELMRAVFSDPANYRIFTCATVPAAHLPALGAPFGALARAA
jgi:UDP-3-O-[3-hydroxymyristoyl] N-acetylglucosamine deacetylase